LLKKLQNIPQKPPIAKKLTIKQVMDWAGPGLAATWPSQAELWADKSKPGHAS